MGPHQGSFRHSTATFFFCILKTVRGPQKLRQCPAPEMELCFLHSLNLFQSTLTRPGTSLCKQFGWHRTTRLSRPRSKWDRACENSDILWLLAWWKGWQSCWENRHVHLPKMDVGSMSNFWGMPLLLWIQEYIIISIVIYRNSNKIKPLESWKFSSREPLPKKVAELTLVYGRYNELVKMG